MSGALAQGHNLAAWYPQGQLYLKQVSELGRTVSDILEVIGPVFLRRHGVIRNTEQTASPTPLILEHMVAVAQDDFVAPVAVSCQPQQIAHRSTGTKHPGFLPKQP